MSYLHATRQQFLDTVEPLTTAQWNYRLTDGVWSIAEVAEHLTLTEAAILTRVEAALAGPAAPDCETETAGKEDIILNRVPHPVRKVQAPGTLTPAGRWDGSSHREMVAEFTARRGRSIEFLETTTAPLRGHMFPHPVLQQLDCYQWFLFLGAHLERHIRQMQEVMASPGFPTA